MGVFTHLASDKFAIVRLVIGAVMISLSGVFVKLVSVGPTSSAFWRVCIGGVVLCVWVLYHRRQLVPKGRSLMWLVIAGFAFAVDLFVWHKSIIYVGVGLSTLLGNFQVFFMAAAAVLIFGERISIHQIVAIPLAILGLYLIVGVDWAELPATSKAGVALGLATAVAYAAYMLSLRQARWAAPTREAAADLAIASVVSAFFLAVTAWLTHESLAIPTLTDAGLLTIYALIGQVVGWVLISSSLPYVPTINIGIALLIQPILAYVWDVMIFSRALSLTEVVGALIAIFAIYLGSKRVEHAPDRVQDYDG